MTSATDPAVANHRTNLNRLLAIPQPHAPAVVTSVAANRIECPREAAAALEIENVAAAVLSLLGDIASRRTRSAALVSASTATIT
jgi:hypothetical protein